MTAFAESICHLLLAQLEQVLLLLLLLQDNVGVESDICNLLGAVSSLLFSAALCQFEIACEASAARYRMHLHMQAA